MFKIRIWLSFVLVRYAFHVHIHLKLNPQNNSPMSDQKRISEIADSLAIDDPMGEMLQTGFRGIGIHEPWMNSMKSQA